jgi:hypothetical protein
MNVLLPFVLTWIGDLRADAILVAGADVDRDADADADVGTRGTQIRLHGRAATTIQRQGTSARTALSSPP